jgi:hypothetical protein
MNTIVATLTSSVTDIQTQALAAIGGVLPIALVIMGSIVVIGVGVAVFKKFKH